MSSCAAARSTLLVRLQAAAHLFLRPVQVIGENPEIDRKFLPPESVSEEIWGPEVVLAYVAWNHYEATVSESLGKRQDPE